MSGFIPYFVLHIVFSWLIENLLEKKFSNLVILKFWIYNFIIKICNLKFLITTLNNCPNNNNNNNNNNNYYYYYYLSSLPVAVVIFYLGGWEFFFTPIW